MVKTDEKHRDTEIYLSQWKTCVEMANSVSQRRDVMNKLFVTLHMSIIAANTFFLKDGHIVLYLVGIIMCVIWGILINNFKELNTAKFKIIQKIEDHLPIKAFADEWEELQENKNYIRGTKIECLFPLLFAGIYIVILLFYYKKVGI